MERAAEQLDRLIAAVEESDDASLRDRVFEILEAIDALHRPLVWRVAELVHRDRPALFAEGLLEDPVASILFEMYGLVSPKQRDEAATAEGEARPDAFVSLADLTASVPQPLGWHAAGPLRDVRDDRLVARDVEGERLILVRAGDDVRAFRDRCPGTAMPLNMGAVRDGVILCPWHDCRFDIVSGRRVDAEGAALESVPVAVRDDEIRVGLRSGKRAA